MTPFDACTDRCSYCDELPELCECFSLNEILDDATREEEIERSLRIEPDLFIF